MNRFSCALVEVKKSHYRPGQALMVPGGSDSQISRQSANEGGKVVSPRHRPPFPPGNIPGTHFCYRRSRPQDQVRLEGLCQWKIPMTIVNRTRDLPACSVVPHKLRQLCTDGLHVPSIRPSETRRICQTAELQEWKVKGHTMRWWEIPQHKTSRKTKKKMVGNCPEGCTTDTWG